MKLHDFQTRAVASVQSAWAAGSRRVLLVSPTGSGKTTQATEIARQEIASGGRVLYVVHREEIYKQTVARLQSVGLTFGTLKKPAAVVVAMVQTLAARGAGCLPWYPTLLIVDECHHLVANSWKSVYGWFDQVRILGLTATPWGIDPLLVDASIIAATPSELVASGHMAPMQILAYGEPDTSAVRIRGGEFVTQDLEQATNVRELRGDVLQAYLANPLPAFGVAVNVRTSVSRRTPQCRPLS